MNIRNVNSLDAILLRELAHRCKPLDVHTPYTYWVVCNFFSDGCFILEENDIPVGYIMTIYKDDILFIWQIGILEEYRGKKYSRLLLEAVTQFAQNKKFKKMLASIGPDNQNSYHAFHQFCMHNNISIVHNGDVTLYHPIDNIDEHEHIYEMTL